MQLLFYLWFLRELYDIEKVCVIAYPTERTRESITLDSGTTDDVERTLAGIIDFVYQKRPPELEKKSY